MTAILRKQLNQNDYKMMIIGIVTILCYQIIIISNSYRVGRTNSNNSMSSKGCYGDDMRVDLVQSLKHKNIISVTTEKHKSPESVNLHQAGLMAVVKQPILPVERGRVVECTCAKYKSVSKYSGIPVS